MTLLRAAALRGQAAALRGPARLWKAAPGAGARRCVTFGGRLEDVTDREMWFHGELHRLMARWVREGKPPGRQVVDGGKEELPASVGAERRAKSA